MGDLGGDVGDGGKNEVESCGRSVKGKGRRMNLLWKNRRKIEEIEV
jgi:hypothetical protein